MNSQSPMHVECGVRSARPLRASRTLAERPYRLEYESYKWKSEDSKRFVIAKHRCNCRTCPDCGRRRGYETREALLRDEVIQLFKRPVLLTFTVDPKRFTSPEAAHAYVTSEGFLRRLMKFLNIRIWVWVLEFQKKGWPHWHIIADVSERGTLKPDDMRRCWALWRDKWGIGGFDLRARKNFATASHAILYITKYLTSPGKNPFPAWFLAGKRRRLCQGSKSVGRLTMCVSTAHKEISNEERKRKEARPLIDRMAECGMSSNVMLETVDSESGRSKYKFLANIQCSPEKLLELSHADSLPGITSISRKELKRLGYSTSAFLIDRFDGDISNTINDIIWYLDLSGDLSSRTVEIEDRKNYLCNALYS